MTQPFSYTDAPSMIGSWIYRPGVSGLTPGVNPGVLKYQATILGMVKESSGYDVAGKSFDLDVDGTTYPVAFTGTGLLSLAQVVSQINVAAGATVAKAENGFLRLTSPTSGESSFIGVYTDPASTPKDVLYLLGLFSGVESRGGDLVDAPQLDSWRQRVFPRQLSWSEGESVSAAAFNRSMLQLSINQDRDHGFLEHKRLAGLKEVEVTLGAGDTTFDLADSVYTGPVVTPTTEQLENVVMFCDQNYSEVVVREFVDDGSPISGYYAPVTGGGEGTKFTSSTASFSQADATGEKYLTGTHVNLLSLLGLPLKIIEWIDNYTVRLSNVDADGKVVEVNTPVTTAQKSTRSPWTVRTSGIYDVAAPSNRVEKVTKSKVSSTTISRVDFNNRVVCAGASFLSLGLLEGDLVTITGHTVTQPYSNNGTYRVKSVVDNETLELFSSDWGATFLNPTGTLGSLTITTDGDFFYNVRVHLDKAPGAGTYKVLYKSMSNLRSILETDVGALAAAQLKNQEEGDDVIEKALLAVIGPNASSISDYLYNDARYSLERAYGLVTAEHYAYDENDTPGRHRYIHSDAIENINSVVGRTGIVCANNVAGTAISGRSSVTTGASAGVYGSVNSVTDDSVGVEGDANGSTGKTYGVLGYNFSETLGASAICGQALGNGPVYGAYGFCESSVLHADSCAVRGYHAGAGYGGYFQATSGIGLYSTINSSNKAIYGNNSGLGYAGYFVSAGNALYASTAGGGYTAIYGAGTGLGGYGISGVTVSGRGVNAYSSGTGVALWAHSVGGSGINSDCDADLDGACGIYGTNTVASTTHYVYGVQGYITATCGGSSAVVGTCAGTSGDTNGVYGWCASSTGKGVYGYNSSSGYGGWFQSVGGNGVYGIAAASGVYGVYGQNNTAGHGVGGVTSTGYGVYGSASSSGTGGYFTSSIGTGLWGEALHVSNAVTGIWGKTTSSHQGSHGVYGEATYGSGVYGHSTAAGATGVYGDNSEATGGAYGVAGVVISTSSSSYAVYGNAQGGHGVGSGAGYGGYFTSALGTGVYATTAAALPGVCAITGDASGNSSVVGVQGYSNSIDPDSKGVWGRHAQSGYGGYFTVGASPGIAGYFSAPAGGAAIVTSGWVGIGVALPTDASLSIMHAGTASTYGIKCQSAVTTTGYSAIYGIMTAATTNKVYGVRGSVNSSNTDSAAIYGPSGSAAVGVLGENTDTSGLFAAKGVVGKVVSGNSGSLGVSGSATSGIGVYGSSTLYAGLYGSGYTYGVYGTADNGSSSSAVCGGYFWASTTSGSPSFVRGVYADTNGQNTTTSVYGAELKGNNGAVNTYGAYCQGSSNVAGSYVYGVYCSALGSTVNKYDLYAAFGGKSWVNPHPVDPTKAIVYFTVESNTHEALFRGKGSLVNGRATVELPDHFKYTVSPNDDPLVIVTPMSASSKGLALVESSNESFTVEELSNGRGSYEFSFIVMAKRRGYETAENMIENRDYVPFQGNLFNIVDGEDTQEFYDNNLSHLNAIFRSNGTLTSDGKVNKAVFKNKNWEHRERLPGGDVKVTVGNESKTWTKQEWGSRKESRSAR